MKFRILIIVSGRDTGNRKRKGQFFLRRFVMHLGKDFWLVARMIMAIIDALRKLFEKENEDDDEHNGE